MFVNNIYHLKPQSLKSQSLSINLTENYQMIRIRRYFKVKCCVVVFLNRLAFILIDIHSVTDSPGVIFLMDIKASN